ncbi:MAG: hypothetical protein HQL28_05225 [Candidatus Omnitrophica bacterium]|nr:hypothetical protein [Candidatus Omnitrophota bacterium]
MTMDMSEKRKFIRHLLVSPLEYKVSDDKIRVGGLKLVHVVFHYKMFSVLTLFPVGFIAAADQSLNIYIGSISIFYPINFGKEFIGFCSYSDHINFSTLIFGSFSEISDYIPNGDPVPRHAVDIFFIVKDVPYLALLHPSHGCRQKRLHG